MQSKLAHRGPDDRGLFISDDGHCALAHTRLSILDLSSAGHQPMGMGWGKIRNSKSEIRNEQQARYWITYNGEIYNYRELRRELGAWSTEQGAGSGGNQGSEVGSKPEIGDQRSGVGGQILELSRNTSAVSRLQSSVNTDWQSNTDTEVILRAYARWGRECVNHLRGMFAFAIWDEQKQELFLARDPLGIKPLYYYQTDHLFLFASEIRALLASGLVLRKLSLDGFASYLEFGSVQDPLTIVDGVQSLLPGHCLVVKTEDRRPKTELFRCSGNLFNETSDSVPASRPEAVKLLRSKLEDSVRQHLVSDVPVGAFLSGGIDSSAIVALMSRVAGQKPKTFSVIFKEVEFSEADHAQLMAHKFDTEHREIMLSEDHLLSMLPDALDAMDQPTMDGINTYVVSKAVKESGVTVALSGLGGDELFAGYPSFLRAKQLRKMAMLPQPFRNAAGGLGRAFLNGSARHQKFWDLVESDCSPYAAYSLSRRLFAPAEIAALTRGQRSEVSGQRAEFGKSEIRNPQSEIGRSLFALNASRLALSSLPKTDIINEVSVLELTGYMANTLLRDTDQMSMAHALEVRVPFVDPQVVQFVLGLPGEWKVNGGRPKPLLVDALADLLPEEIWRRPKMGFTLPFQRWIQSGLRSEVAATLSSDRDLSRLGLSTDSCRSMWDSFAKNPSQEPWSRPWSLYVLAKWCELNDVTADGL
jgi:asparagine synthase (glutamine-hydrolysing)